MNIYEDYQNYIAQFQNFIDKLKKADSPIVYLFEDTLAVLDYTAKLHGEHSKIDEDLQEAFDVGFRYLITVFADLKVYYKDYFKNSIERLNYFAVLIVYTINLDDYLEYLKDEEILTADLKEVIDNIQTKIDHLLVNNKNYDSQLIDQFDMELAEHTSSNDRFTPIPSIFSRIREVLDLI